MTREKVKTNKSVNQISLAVLRRMILESKITKGQESFLLAELPKMTKQEKLSLFGMLERVYILNQQEERAIQKIKSNWIN